MADASEMPGLLGDGTQGGGWTPKAPGAPGSPSLLGGSSGGASGAFATQSPLVGGGSGGAPPAGPTGKSLLAYARNPTPVAGSGASVGGLTGVASHANVTDLNPEFLKRAAAFQQAAKAAGVETTVLSGFRPNDQQARLYANYQAKLSGQPLPYPAESSGGIAAPPGKSYHNSGNAMDMYATDPAKQGWLVENAPKFGLYPGANFGDPGHFQIAGANPGGDHTGGSGGSGSSTSPIVASATSPAPPVAPASDAPPAPQNPTDLIRNEMKLALIRNMFPQHAITPVAYDPFKAVPQGLGDKVDVNQGVG